MLKKARIWYWTTSAFIKKYALGLTVGSMAGVILVIYSNTLLRLIPIASTHHLGRIGTVTLAQMPLDIQQYVSRGLTKINPKGEWIPDIASNIEPNQDGTEYTVTLKNDIFWPDGKPLTTADIDLNIKDVAIQKPDPHTIIFSLKEPFAPFPSILSQPILRKTSQGMLRKKTIITGLNQFAITEVETSGQFLKKVTLSSSKSTRVYHFFPTEDDAIIAFKLGKIDTIQEITSPQQLADWSNVDTVKATAGNRYLALFFNTSNQILQDKSIRQALAYATPKSTDDDRVISPISRQSWAYNPQVKPYIQNIGTAKETLDRLKAANPSLSLELTLTTTPAYVDIAQSIINDWKQLDIDVALQIVPMPDTNDYQILLIGQQIPDDPDQYLLWHSTQNTNISKYQSPKIDKLLEDGRKEIRREERKQIYFDFQRFLVEDCPVVFLHQLENYTITRSKADLSNF